MNARLLALRPHSNRSGSISYLRIIALPALASADAIRPSVSPSQSKSSRRNYRSQNAPLTPLASALTQVRIPKHLKQDYSLHKSIFPDYYPVMNDLKPRKYAGFWVGMGGE